MLLIIISLIFNFIIFKYERFFHQDAIVVATMFAPIVYPPCSVIAMKYCKDGSFVSIF